MTRAEFYRLRDARTASCVPSRGLEGEAVAIAADGVAAEGFDGQVTLATAANLVARWCRRVRFDVPNADLHTRLRLPGAPTSLPQYLLWLASSADPFGDFGVGGREHGMLSLEVGRAAAWQDSYRVSGNGWLASADVGGLTPPTRQLRSLNPFGPLMAGCIGASLVFKAALGREGLTEDALLSLWNLGAESAAGVGPELPERIDLGELLLVGCGAVGSAMAYILPVLGASATVDLVDDDHVDVTNLNRSPMFFAKDVGRPKVDVVATHLRAHGMTANPVKAWFAEAVRAGRIFRRRPDLVIPTANERGVRAAVQHQVPPLQVYGTTNSDWQAFLGRHIPFRDDCLACRFPEAQAPMPPLKCGSVPLPADHPSGGVRDAAVPFLSSAAAILAVAELTKLTLGQPINGNFACLDFGGRTPRVLAMQTPFRPGCLCRGQEGVWDELNGKTRFAGLSQGGGVNHAKGLEPLAKRAS